ncbi:MAG TPA: response regulator [Sulfuricella sp.]|nr:response regulator [Sulfuricella sp.]
MPESIALVVDTSPVIRDYVQKILMDEVLVVDEVHQAKNADEALRIMESNGPINWVFIEYEMSGISHIDFLENLRKIPGCAETYFVLMTAMGEKEARNSAIDEGASDYICKPFTPQQFARKVHRLSGLAEWRRSKRHEVCLPCEFGLGSDSFHHYGAELMDIALTGCRMRTSQLHPGKGNENETGTVTFFPEDGPPFHVEVKIKRVEFDKWCADPLRNTRAAFEFINVSQPVKGKLEGYVDLCRKKTAFK